MLLTRVFAQILKIELLELELLLCDAFFQSFLFHSFVEFIDRDIPSIVDIINVKNQLCYLILFV